LFYDPLRVLRVLRGENKMKNDEYIAIVDYGMGNVRSVGNAFKALGVQTELTHDEERLSAARGIVLPGVGAFGDGMKNLKQRGLVETLTRLVIGEGKPFLGICLGMQLVARRGFELGEHEGLGWLEADVVALESKDRGLRIPHMGWNETKVLKPDGIFQEMGAEPVFYYLHSFHLKPAARDAEWAAATCSHGVEFVSAIERGKLFGVQFHPEKSQGSGLKLLENYLKYCDVRIGEKAAC
jgi:imidazole glycerol-phosphate synthase subunit HisH